MVTKFSDKVMNSWPAGDSNRVEEVQTAQIAALQVQVTRLDNASKNQVFVDPVKSTQEELYTHLISIREGMHKSLAEAVENCSVGGAQASPAASTSVVSNEEVTSLKADNKKL